MEYIAHHGIKGQRWGIRRYQNPDGSLTEAGKKHYRIPSYNKSGGYIPKGSVLYRVSLHKDDPTFAGTKYVSTSKYDHKLWEDYLVDAYAKRGRDTYNIKYKTTRDLKIANETELGRRFAQEWQKDAIGTAVQTKSAMDFMGYYPEQSERTGAKLASLNIAAETNLGKKFVSDLMNSGYDAVTDTHGTNVAYDPVILLNPDDGKLKMVKSKRY